jgi:2-polyprenyl-3-methyl-5-hydroxy-6-metoxy-1,4-benzoquinol methylase
MTANINELARYLIYRAAERIPDEKLSQLLYDLIKRRVQSIAPRAALRFLFELDAKLYELQGSASVAYDGGIHTKHRHMKYHDFFTKRIRREDRVLDIGCGIGAVAYDVAKQTGAFVLGMDFNAESIHTAQERFKHPNLVFRLGDALKDLPEESYTVIILSNVLEHLPERSAFLRRVQESAHPQRMLIRVPLFERDWRVPLKKEIGVEWRLDLTHETEYTQEEFEQEMNAAGLVVAYKEIRWGEIWAEVVTDDSKS